MPITSLVAGAIASLPAQAQTKEGFIFSPEASIWQIPDQSASLSFNYRALSECCTEEIVIQCKKVLLIYLEQLSARHAINIFERFKHYARTIAAGSGQPVAAITSVSIINYKASLSENESWFLGTLAGFFKRWYRSGHPGVDGEALRLLEGMRLPGNEKGAAVLTHDPYEGPFTDSELTDLMAAANDAFAEGVISMREFLLALLFAALGSRPVQIACLKLKDFHVARGSEGAVEYILEVPRAKQRNSLRRSQATTRILYAEIGEILSKWIGHIQNRFAIELADGFLAGDLPLLPANNNNISAVNKGFKFHSRANEISKELTATFKKLDVVSPRTGNPLNVTPIRFRRTLGTRAAEEGHGELIIAQLLDQSDI